MTRAAQPKPVPVPPPPLKDLRLEVAAAHRSLPVVGRPSLDFGDR